MAPGRGLEPPTNRLTADRSTTELPGNDLLSVQRSKKIHIYNTKSSLSILFVDIKLKIIGNISGITFIMNSLWKNKLPFQK